MRAPERFYGYFIFLDYSTFSPNYSKNYRKIVKTLESMGAKRIQYSVWFLSSQLFSSKKLDEFTNLLKHTGGFFKLNVIKANVLKATVVESEIKHLTRQMNVVNFKHIFKTTKAEIITI